eukprot:2376109-Rhodomonas_salina.6
MTSCPSCQCLSSSQSAPLRALSARCLIPTQAMSRRERWALKKGSTGKKMMMPGPEELKYGGLGKGA